MRRHTMPARFAALLGAPLAALLAGTGAHAASAMAELTVSAAPAAPLAAAAAVPFIAPASGRQAAVTPQTVAPASGAAAAVPPANASASGLPSAQAATAPPVAAVANDALASAVTDAGKSNDLDDDANLTPEQREEKLLYREGVRALTQGRPDEASSILSRLLEKNAQHAGAWLDLALSQCELGKAAEAERLFQLVIDRFSPSPAIIGLIQSYRDRGCTVEAGPRSTFSYKLARGYDTNVNQGSNSPFFVGDPIPMEAVPRSDYYSLLTADYTRPLGAGVQLIGQLRVLNNDTVREQDNNTLLLGLERSWRLGSWSGRATAVAGAVQLDHKLYQKQAQLQFRAIPPVKLPESWSGSLIAGLSRVEYPSRPFYNANTLDLGVNLAYHSKQSYVLLSAGGLTDHGGETRPGGDRRGWYGGVQAYTSLGKSVTAEAGWNYQRWTGASVYFPGDIDVVRRQNTRQLRGALVFPVASRDSLQIEVRRIRNLESIAAFQYNSRMIQLSWRHDDY